ncbi:MAG: hypothetical protein OXH60_11240 [Rhodospirillales bacterium]|nr:hypothetical protein [Rhodospirillales bacterium]
MQELPRAGAHPTRETGPSAGRDPAYKLASTIIKGTVPSIRYKACNESPQLKSNACIVAEIERFADTGGLWRLEETVSCRNPACRNHGRSIALHPEAYIRRGRPASGDRQYFQCKACGRKVLVSLPVRLHAEHQTLAADVLSRIANKSPVRGTGRGVRLKSMKAYYPIVDFIYSRCRAYSGAVDRALIDETLRFPKDLVLETDRQDYTLNWTSRLDRRNVDLSGYCSVNSGSRFILGLHVNLDERVDPFEVAVDAVRSGDFDVAEPYRKYARCWLPGDELNAGRSRHPSLPGRPDVHGAHGAVRGGASLAEAAQARRSRPTEARGRCGGSAYRPLRYPLCPAGTTARPRHARSLEASCRSSGEVTTAAEQASGSSREARLRNAMPGFRALLRPSPVCALITVSGSAFGLCGCRGLPNGVICGRGSSRATLAGTTRRTGMP